MSWRSAGRASAEAGSSKRAMAPVLTRARRYATTPACGIKGDTVREPIAGWIREKGAPSSHKLATGCLEMVGPPEEAHTASRDQNL